MNATGAVAAVEPPPVPNLANMHLRKSIDLALLWICFVTRILAGPEQVPITAYGVIKLPELAPLLASTEALSTCGTQHDLLSQLYPSNNMAPGQLPTMETFGQAYGFILYERVAAPFALDHNASTKGLAFSGRTMHDRVQIFTDGQPLTTVFRPECGCASSGAGSFCHVPLPKSGRELQLLVENMGRVNFGSEVDPKGIGDVAPMTGNWSAKCLSLEPSDVSALPYQPAGVAENERNLTDMPVFRRGKLNITGAPKDTYLDTRGLTKGLVWVNGRNLGRYWEAAGPQHALYCPAPFLQAGANEIIILDLHGAGAGGLHSVAAQRWGEPATLPPPWPAFPAADACERFCATHVVGDDGTPDCCQCDVAAVSQCQSSNQLPSCAMGCAAAKATPTLVACQQACKNATCDFTVNGKIIGSTCGMCPCGCKPAGSGGGTTQPGMHNVSGCLAGCSYAHRAATVRVAQAPGVS